jgi:hypothetical protein
MSRWALATFNEYPVCRHGSLAASLTTSDRSIDPTTPPTPPIMLSWVISSRRVGEGSPEKDHGKRSLSLSQRHQRHANVSKLIQRGPTRTVREVYRTGNGTWPLP